MLAALLRIRDSSAADDVNSVQTINDAPTDVARRSRSVPDLDDAGHDQPPTAHCLAVGPDSSASVQRSKTCDPMVVIPRPGGPDNASAVHADFDSKLSDPTMLTAPCSWRRQDNRKDIVGRRFAEQHPPGLRSRVRCRAVHQAISSGPELSVVALCQKVSVVRTG